MYIHTNVNAFMHVHMYECKKIQFTNLHQYFFQCAIAANHMGVLTFATSTAAAGESVKCSLAGFGVAPLATLLTVSQQGEKNLVWVAEVSDTENYDLINMNIL